MVVGRECTKSIAEEEKGTEGCRQQEKNSRDDSRWRPAWAADSAVANVGLAAVDGQEAIAIVALYLSIIFGSDQKWAACVRGITGINNRIPSNHSSVYK